MPLPAVWIQLEMIVLNEEKDEYMISLICGIQNITQKNLSMKQK